MVGNKIMDKFVFWNVLPIYVTDVLSQSGYTLELYVREHTKPLYFPRLSC